MNSAKRKDERFVDFLQKNAEDKGMLADLRRGLGQPPGTVLSMFPYVERFNPNQYEIARFYMIAALFALHPSSAKSSNSNMGNHLRDYYRDDDSRKEATERRLIQLLQLQLEFLEPRLRQHINMLKSKNIDVNWHRLMRDLRNWDHPDRFVQRQWAQAFWQSNQSESQIDDGKESSQ